MSSPLLSSDPRLAAAAAEPRSAVELESILGDLLDTVLSSRRTATPLADAVAPLDRAAQDFVVHWVSVIARTNGEMAYQFAQAAPAALRLLELPAAEAWAIEAMDVYDREGLYRGSQVFKHPEEFESAADRGAAAVSFGDVAHVLQLFVHGLSGRRVRLDIAPRGFTDTEVLYFPARISHGASAEENFLLYKAMAALLWAQSRYGTFNADLEAACARFADRDRAVAVLNVLETVRLEACIARMLPGLYREMQKVRGPSPVDSRCAQLLEPGASVEDSITLLGVVYDSPPELRHPYMGVLDPAQAAAARRRRLAREKHALQQALAKMIEAEGGNPDAIEAPRFTFELSDEKRLDGMPDYELKLDDATVVPPPDVAKLIDSVVQDLGMLPDDYLAPAPGAGLPVAGHEQDEDDIWKGIQHDAGAFFYNEWDYNRRHYRKNWCVLRELDVTPGDATFVESTLRKYAPQIRELKRAFEWLRGEDRTLKRQPEGDGFDLDAVIEGYADMRSGMQLSEQLFTRRRKSERDLAVMFMVDMSGSTKGWINDAEREALVMLCEALQVLGDRYAIYGFSGITRKRCEIFRVKRFGEAYGPDVQGRIAGIAPQDYTRMGAAIRHLTMRLNQVEARTKLLITLSDGKPDDYSDNYRGEYGIEDTRHALVEAHRSGIKPFCITIDREARDYLPHMYGSVNWTLVDDVAHLPVKVADIYRKLTA